MNRSDIAQVFSDRDRTTGDLVREQVVYRLRADPQISDPLIYGKNIAAVTSIAGELPTEISADWLFVALSAVNRTEGAGFILAEVRVGIAAYIHLARVETEDETLPSYITLMEHVGRVLRLPGAELLRIEDLPGKPAIAFRSLVPIDSPRWYRNTSEPGIDLFRQDFEITYEVREDPYTFRPVNVVTVTGS